MRADLREYYMRTLSAYHVALCLLIEKGFIEQVSRRAAELFEASLAAGSALTRT
jgi:hypothetical protein